MRSLAAFIMRSRSTAVLAATIFALVFWFFPPALIVAGAVIALITLRQGAFEGALIALLAGTVITGLMGLLFGRPGLMFEVLLSCWLPIWLLALVLRTTISLPRTFQAAALLGLSGLVIFYLLAPDLSTWWEQLLLSLRQELIASRGTAQAMDATALDQLLRMVAGWAPYLSGHLVGAMLMTVLLGLLLGRWWQSVLFNPGGFGFEFRELRLGQSLALLTLVAFVAALLASWPPLTNLALVLSVLYTLQGIAIVHGLIFKLQLSPTWLLLFYLLLLPLLSQMVMALGVADAWVDFRNRIRPPPNQQ